METIQKYSLETALKNIWLFLEQNLNWLLLGV